MERDAMALEILADLARHGCPQQAEPMARYMRDQFPFFGVKTPRRQELLRVHAARVNDWTQLQRLSELLFTAPQREAHYAALDLLQARRDLWTPEVLLLLERLTLTHSWWDTVDRIAAPLVWQAFQMFPQELARPDRWIEHPSLWRQRVALLYQRTAKEKTDRDRLARYIEATMDSPEFFLRKAIGWALRQYGYTDPEWVRAFVQRRRDRLSALSLREATRALPSPP
jgi:3-methyladenine DNA glycosylase AlkD